MYSRTVRSFLAYIDFVVLQSFLSVAPNLPRPVGKQAYCDYGARGSFLFSLFAPALLGVIALHILDSPVRG
jgi:hypothetical protein